MTSQPKLAKLFIGLMALGGLVSLSQGLLHLHSLHHFLFAALLVIALLASRLKLQLPGLSGNMSMNLPFILIAFVELSAFEALMIALASTLAQCFSKNRGKPKVVQTLFNASTMAIGVGLAELVFQGKPPLIAAWVSGSLLLVFAGATFFLFQTIPVATIIALTEGGKMVRIWSSIVHMSLPYYVLSAGVASIVTTASQHLGWQIPLFALPVMYGVYRSYQSYFGCPRASSRPATLARAAACN